MTKMGESAAPGVEQWRSPQRAGSLGGAAACPACGGGIIPTGPPPRSLPTLQVALVHAARERGPRDKHLLRSARTAPP